MTLLKAKTLSPSISPAISKRQTWHNFIIQPKKLLAWTLLFLAPAKTNNPVEVDDHLARDFNLTNEQTTYFYSSANIITISSLTCLFLLLDFAAYQYYKKQIRVTASQDEASEEPVSRKVIRHKLKNFNYHSVTNQVNEINLIEKTSSTLTTLATTELAKKSNLTIKPALSTKEMQTLKILAVLKDKKEKLLAKKSHVKYLKNKKTVSNAYSIKTKLSVTKEKQRSNSFTLPKKDKVSAMTLFARRSSAPIIHTAPAVSSIFITQAIECILSLTRTLRVEASFSDTTSSLSLLQNHLARLHLIFRCINSINLYAKKYSKDPSIYYKLNLMRNMIIHGGALHASITDTIDTSHDLILLFTPLIAALKQNSSSDNLVNQTINELANFTIINSIFFSNTEKYANLLTSNNFVINSTVTNEDEDNLYLLWIKKCMFPFINCLSLPLLQIYNQQTDNDFFSKTHAKTLEAISMLFVFCGDFLNSDRQVRFIKKMTDLTVILLNIHKIRNKIAHTISIISADAVLDICKDIQCYSTAVHSNKKLVELAEKDNFNFSPNQSLSQATVFFATPGFEKVENVENKKRERMVVIKRRVSM